MLKSSCLFVWVVKKRSNFKDGLLKEDVPGMKCQQHFFPNQLLPNMLHHVRGKRGECCRHARLLFYSMLYLWSQFHGKMLPEQDVMYWLSISTKCNLPQRALWVDRNVLIYSSLLCWNYEYPLNPSVTVPFKRLSSLKNMLVPNWNVPADVKRI